MYTGSRPRVKVEQGLGYLLTPSPVHALTLQRWCAVEPHRGARHGQAVGEQADQGLVGGAVHRRGRETNLQRVAV